MVLWKEFLMGKVESKNFKYNLFKPLIHNINGTSVIFYHGWETDADSYSDLAEDIAKKWVKEAN